MRYSQNCQGHTGDKFIMQKQGLDISSHPYISSISLAWRLMTPSRKLFVPCATVLTSLKWWLYGQGRIWLWGWHLPRKRRIKN